MMSSEPRIQAVDATSEILREETVGRNSFSLDCDARRPPTFGKDRADVSSVAFAHLVLSGSNYGSPEVAVKKTTTSLGRFIVSNFFLTFNFYQRYCYYYYFRLIAIMSVVAQ